jgi:electron transfer flavoprotein beta subunit
MAVDIIVCLSQIEEDVQDYASAISPAERSALAEGLRIKEGFWGKLIALTMAPERKALDEALATGADKGIFLYDKAFAGADSLATAYTLFYGIRQLGHFDLILCGNQSSRGSTGQVGPQLAELLNIPCVTCARRIEFVNQRSIIVETALEYGYMEVKVELPALIAVVKEINKPKLPTAWGIIEAAKKETRIWGLHAIEADPNTVGLTGSPTQLVREFKLQTQRRKEILQGEPRQVVRKAIEKLQELGAI